MDFGATLGSSSSILECTSQQHLLACKLHCKMKTFHAHQSSNWYLSQCASLGAAHWPQNPVFCSCMGWTATRTSASFPGSFWQTHSPGWGRRSFHVWWDWGLTAGIIWEGLSHCQPRSLCLFLSSGDEALCRTTLTKRLGYHSTGSTISISL